MNQERLSKGFFPYKLNTGNNFNKTLPTYPPRELYSTDDFSEADKHEFDLWYASVESKQFNIGEKLISYCEQDVMVLMEACRLFRQSMLEETG